MEENKSDIGSSGISFTTFLLRLLAGGAGGVVGSLILLLIFIFAGSLLSPITEGQNFEGYISPIFIFILMMMTFLASTAGNLLSAFLLALTERDKYTRIATAIYQIFIISILIFLLMVPVYFIASSVDIGITGYAVALHIIISAMASALILEIICNYKYALIGVYGITFSILISAAVLFGLSSLVQSPTILLFAALPVVWGSIAFTGSLVTMIYNGIARAYDKDFLASSTFYGADYGKQFEHEQQIKEPKVKDSEGADFLRKTK